MQCLWPVPWWVHVFMLWLQLGWRMCFNHFALQNINSWIMTTFLPPNQMTSKYVASASYGSLLFCLVVHVMFRLGFDCAQLPKLARHKYDDHLLSLDFWKDETCEGDYWCEICEKKIGGNALFYTCKEDYCCSTFHTHCVVGALYLKLKQCFKLFSHEFEVVENSLSALRHCCICGLECKGLEVIMSQGDGGGGDDKYLCSSSCFMRNRRLLKNL